MALLSPSRLALPHVCKVVLAICCLFTFNATLPAAPRPGFGQRPPAPSRSQPQQEHLSQWMDRHRNMPLSQQQSALEKEPGFHDLPPLTQQRMRDRLTQLNNMSPEQRKRLLARTEAMEQLTPQQRQQVRGAMQQLSNLPIDRRSLVARAFRNMREMPIPQRQIVLNSDHIRNQFSPQERETLGNLLAVEPYLPGPHAGEPGGYSK